MKTYHAVSLVKAQATIHGVKLYNPHGRTGFNFRSGTAENRREFSPGPLRFGAPPKPGECGVPNTVLPAGFKL